MSFGGGFGGFGQNNNTQQSAFGGGGGFGSTNTPPTSGTFLNLFPLLAYLRTGVCLSLGPSDTARPYRLLECSLRETGFGSTANTGFGATNTGGGLFGSGGTGTTGGFGSGGMSVPCSGSFWHLSLRRAVSSYLSKSSLSHPHPFRSQILGYLSHSNHGST